MDLRHSFKEWSDGPLFRCAMRVSMPDDATMTFFGDGKSAANARRTAAFKAAFAANEQRLRQFAGATASSDTDEDIFLERVQLPPASPPSPARDVELIHPRRPPPADPPRAPSADSSDEDAVEDIPLALRRADARRVLAARRGAPPLDRAASHPGAKAFAPARAARGGAHPGARSGPHAVLVDKDGHDPNRDDDTLPRGSHALEPRSSSDISPPQHTRHRVHATKATASGGARKADAAACGSGRKGEGASLVSDLYAEALHKVKVLRKARKGVEKQVEEPPVVALDESLDEEANALFVEASETPLWREAQGEDEGEILLELEPANGVSPFASTVQGDGGHAKGSAVGGFRFGSPHSANGDEYSRKQGIMFHMETSQDRFPSLRNEDGMEQGDEEATRAAKGSPSSRVAQNNKEVVRGAKDRSPIPRVGALTSKPRKRVAHVAERKGKVVKGLDQEKSPNILGRRRVRGASSAEFDNDSVIDVDMPDAGGFRPASRMKHKRKAPPRRTLQLMDDLPVPSLKRQRSVGPDRPRGLAASAPSTTFRRSRMRVKSAPKGSRKPRRLSLMETLKARLQESCDKAPSADGELEDGWNEIPRVRSAAGGRGIVPIPRVTSKQKSTARSAVSLDDEREKAPAVKDAQTEEDARPELPRTSGDPISLKRREPNRALPALNNPTEDGFQRRMGENEDGWHQAVTGASGGLTSDPGVRNQGSQAAPSMNPTVPGMFLFPTPEGMAQAHPVPPLGMVPPPPPPNMFMPVMHQNAFFPGAPIPPNLFGIPPPEHPQAQWQREAVKAAWLDHQIQHKQQFQHQKKTTVVHAEEMKGRSAKPARQQVEHIEILQREEAPVVTVQVEEIDSPPPAITDKVPPEAPKADTTTREVSSDEGEDGEDHVSTLHVLSQRLRKWTNPVFAWDRKDARGHWVCTGTVKVLFKEGEEFLKKTVNAKSRKRAKQKVSKQLIAALKEMIAASRKAESSGDAGSPSEEIDKMTGISTAVGALTQLFHRHKLDTQPDTRFEEIGGGLWRCTVIMAISGVGKVKVSEEGPQKKLAKSVASLKALERLRELKVIRPEEFSHLKLCQTGKEGREAVSAKEANKMRSAREDIVQISDDDDDDDGEKKVTTEEDGEGRFLLPKHYLIVEATKPEHCEEWRTTHAKPGSEIGVFVDSCSARREFDGLKTNRVSADGVTKDIGSIRVLCFSTKTSCLVVRKDKCTDEKSKDKDCEEGLWLPEAVCTLLCDRKIQKHGHNVDDGLVWLREYHGIQAWGMNDVSILSSASRSWSHCSNTRVLHGIHELMKYWLKKELVSVCLKDVWRKGSASDEAVVPEGDDTTGMAVVSAFACMCIQEQIRDEAVHKRTRLYGAAAEFRELSRRLMHDPFAK